MELRTLTCATPTGSLPAPKGAPEPKESEMDKLPVPGPKSSRSVLAKPSASQDAAIDAALGKAKPAPASKTKAKPAPKAKAKPKPKPKAKAKAKPAAKKKPAAKAKPKAAAKPASKGKSDGAPKDGGAVAKIISMMQKATGATVVEMAEALEWETKSIHSVISGTLRKKMKLEPTVEKTARGNAYRLPEKLAA